MRINKKIWWLGGQSATPPEAFGTLYDQSSWPNYDNWTATAFTPTIVNTDELEVMGANNFNRYMSHTVYGMTNLINWERTTIFRPQTTGTGEVLLIGIREGGQYVPRSFQAGMIQGGANDGKLRIYRAGALVSTSVAALSWSVNDRIEYVLTRSGFDYTFKARNLTTASGYVTLSFSVTSSNIATALHWIGYFAIYAFNGTHHIESDLCTTVSLKFADTLLIGDSKFEGFSASSLANSFPVIAWTGSAKQYIMMGKGNNTTLDIVNSVQEIINFEPVNCIMGFGCNDVRIGVPIASYEARYTTVRDALAAEGINIYHLRPMKESVVDMTAFNTFLSGFTSDNFIDAFTSFDTGTMLAADGIHPNDTGMQFVADQIAADAPELL